ncbi:hypothetical protein ABLV72_19865, partial [Klebsiella sp. JB_Kp035]|uniref:hypothetical protein n=1 Tax=Klebsiella sp. JB_Kp035 TaxID=3153387 RepID=UPI0032B48EF4
HNPLRGRLTRNLIYSTKPFTKDVSFNSIAGLNLSSIDKLNESYVKHYLRD